MSSIFFILGIFTRESKNMEKFQSPNRAQLFLRNKYTVFTVGGTVNKIFFRRATVLQLRVPFHFYAPEIKDRGAYCFCPICHSVLLSETLTLLTCRTFEQ